MIKSVKEIWSFISLSKRKLSIFQFILSIFVSQIEILNILIFASFLSKIENSASQLQITFLNNFSIAELGIICIFSTIVVMIFTSINTITMSRLGVLIGTEICLKTYEKQVLSDWQLQNDTEVADKLNDSAFASRILGGVFVPLFESFSSLVSTLAILFSLVLAGGIYSLSLIVFIGISYLLITLFFSKKLNEINKQIINLSRTQFSCMNDSFNNSRYNCSSNLVNKNYFSFKKINKELRGYAGDLNIMTNLPRTLIEGIGISAAAFVGLILIFTKNENSLTIVGVLALGIQRLLPRAHLLYRSITNIRACKSLLEKIILSLKLKQDPVLGYVKAKGTKNIYKSYSNLSIKNLSCKIKDNLELKYNNFSINRGEYIGIVGKSGSGKSTLIDLLAGFRCPSKGNIYVDGKPIWGKGSVLTRAKWRFSMGIAEQDPYIFKDSVLNNIVVYNEGSMSKADLYKLKKCIEVSCVDKFFSYKEILKGEELSLGEFGKELSGGMKQRIGLCRALYKSKSWIFIDEGTSSLDINTEKEVIDGLRSEFKEYGILTSAHRTSMIESFDRCIKL